MECHSWWVAAFALTYFKDRSLEPLLRETRRGSPYFTGTICSIVRVNDFAVPSLDRLPRIPDSAGSPRNAALFFCGAINLVKCLGSISGSVACDE
jgi:hypothetical protein